MATPPAVGAPSASHPSTLPVAYPVSYPFPYVTGYVLVPVPAATNPLAFPPGAPSLLQTGVVVGGAPNPFVGASVVPTMAAAVPPGGFAGVAEPGADSGDEAPPGGAEGHASSSFSGVDALLEAAGIAADGEAVEVGGAHTAAAGIDYATAGPLELRAELNCLIADKVNREVDASAQLGHLLECLRDRLDAGDVAIQEFLLSYNFEAPVGASAEVKRFGGLSVFHYALCQSNESIVRYTLDLLTRLPDALTLVVGQAGPFRGNNLCHMVVIGIRKYGGSDLLADLFDKAEASGGLEVVDWLMLNKNMERVSAFSDARGTAVWRHPAGQGKVVGIFMDARKRIKAYHVEKAAAAGPPSHPAMPAGDGAGMGAGEAPAAAAPKKNEKTISGAGEKRGRKAPANNGTRAGAPAKPRKATSMRADDGDSSDSDDGAKAAAKRRRGARAKARVPARAAKKAAGNGHGGGGMVVDSAAAGAGEGRSASKKKTVGFAPKAGSLVAAVARASGKASPPKFAPRRSSRERHLPRPLDVFKKTEATAAERGMHEELHRLVEQLETGFSSGEAVSMDAREALGSISKILSEDNQIAVMELGARKGLAANRLEKLAEREGLSRAQSAALAEIIALLPDD